MKSYAIEIHPADMTVGGHHVETVRLATKVSVVYLTNQNTDDILAELRIGGLHTEEYKIQSLRITETKVTTLIRTR
jgi:hypothetical protein